MSDSREYLTRGLQTSLFDSRMESVADSNVAVLTPLDVEESLELAARTPHLVIPAKAGIHPFSILPTQSHGALHRCAPVGWIRGLEAMESAIQREKAVRKWNRARKTEWIEKGDPSRRGLYNESEEMDGFPLSRE